MTSTLGIDIFGHAINDRRKSSRSVSSKLGSTTNSDVTFIRNNIDMLTLTESGIDVKRNSIVNLAAPTQNTNVANKLYVDTEDSRKLNKSGDTMTGNLDMNNKKICNVSVPVDNDDGANKIYVDSTAVKKSGDSMNGDLDMNSHEILHISSPSDDLSATNKTYVDEKITSAVTSADYIFTDRVPGVDLTSNSTPAPYWCSCDNNSNTAWHAFSHVDDSEWIIENITEGWIMVYTPDSFCVKRLTIRGSRSGLTGNVTRWKFMGTSSDDIWTESVWDRLIECDGVNEINANSNFDIILSSNTRKHKYFKLKIEAGTLPVGINYIGIYNGINTVNIYGDNKMLGDLNMNGFQIVNIADPVANTALVNKKYVDVSYSTSTVLPGVTFLEKQVHRYFNTGTFPNDGSFVILINNASLLIRYLGQIVWANQVHDIHVLNAVLSSGPEALGPVYFSGNWMTPGGNIRLFNTSGMPDFDGVNYWIMIEYTVD